MTQTRDTDRQTGRTARQLEQCVAHARAGGRAIFLVHNSPMVNYARRMLRGLFGEGIERLANNRADYKGGGYVRVLHVERWREGLGLTRPVRFWLDHMVWEQQRAVPRDLAEYLQHEARRGVADAR